MKTAKSPCVKVTALLSALMLMFTFTSCNKEDSDSVNQDKIYTAYEFDYDKNTNITYARAWFRFGNILGTPLELKDPGATITFNGDTMPFKSSLSYYELQFPGALTTGTFIYTDLNNDTYTNTVAMAKPIDWPAIVDTIQRSINNQRTCIGDSLGGGEKFITKVTGPGNIDPQYFTTTGVGMQSVTLLSSQLIMVNQGMGTVRLERKYEPALQQKTLAGGCITSVYTALERAAYMQ